MLKCHVNDKGSNKTKKIMLLANKQAGRRQADGHDLRGLATASGQDWRAGEEHGPAQVCKTASIERVTRMQPNGKA